MNSNRMILAISLAVTTFLFSGELTSTAQDKEDYYVTGKLQHVTIKDTCLLSSLTTMVKDRKKIWCFWDTFLTILFYKSPYYEDTYTVVIDMFVELSEKTVAERRYYISIDGTIFLLASDVPSDILTILPQSRVFSFPKNAPVFLVCEDFMSVLLYEKGKSATIVCNEFLSEIKKR